jgi:hypothetical protein
MKPMIQKKNKKDKVTSSRQISFINLKLSVFDMIDMVTINLNATLNWKEIRLKR